MRAAKSAKPISSDALDRKIDSGADTSAYFAPISEAEFFRSLERSKTAVV